MALVSGLFITFGFAGCARPTQGPPASDEALVRNLVSRVADASRDHTLFGELFAAAALIPEDKARTRCSKLYFEVVAGPYLSGNTASAQVRVRDENRPKPLGQIEWTFVKEGGTWKILKAPVP